MNIENIKQGIIDYTYSFEFDDELYIKELLKRADNGNKEAIKLLKDHIFNTIKETTFLSLNFENFESNEGYTLYFIGKLYFLQEDLKNSKKYAKLALKKECSLSYHLLSLNYFELKKYEKMNKYLQIGIDKYNCEICYNNLAVIYYFGIDVKQDKPKSLEYFKKSYQINPYDFKTIGNLYYFYKFDLKDYKKIKYYENQLLKNNFEIIKKEVINFFNKNFYYLCYKLCLYGLQKNSCLCINTLGILYHKGYYVNKDLKLAKKYYKRAIFRDYTSSMWNISLIYRDEQKYEKEIKYLEMASKHNYETAITRLIDIYKYGLSDQEIDPKKVEYYQNLLEKK